MSHNPKPFLPTPFLPRPSGNRGTQTPSGKATHPSFSRATEPPANSGTQAASTPVPVAHLGQEYGSKQQSSKYNYQHARFRVELDASKEAKPQLILIMLDSEGNEYSGARQILTQGITGPGLWTNRKIYVIERKIKDPPSMRNWEVVYWKVVG